MSETKLVHPAPVRAMHWVNVVAIIVMVGSGWQIYNASPLFDFRFDRSITLGGWLGGALMWHFAGMWLLVINGAVFVAYGLASGHYRRHYFPFSFSSVLAALGDALSVRLPHEPGIYNPLQRVAYVSVLVLAGVLVASGLAIWKPVQLQELTALFGGYDAARYWHFIAMGALLLFLAIHLTMVALLPRTLVAMITGRAPRPKETA